MAQIAKSHKLFYVTIMTKKGNIMTLQTRIPSVMQSHASKAIGDACTFYYKNAKGSMLLLAHAEPNDPRDWQSVRGYVIEAGVLDTAKYIREAVEDGYSL